MARGGNTVVARVGLDDKGFQEGVTKIQRSLKVVKSEFAAASSKLKDFGKSTEGLKLKSDSLNKQMELQKQKVAALTKSYQESVEKKGADAKATENLKVRLNYATAEMNKLQRELNETNEKIKVQESRWTKLGNKLNEAGSKMQTVGKKMQDVGKSLSTKVTAPIVGVESGKSFAELMASGKSVSDVLNMLNDHANKNNLTLKDMFGSVEGGTASMILAGAGGQEFNKVLDTMSNVAGATDTAFNKVNETTGVKLKKAFNSLKNAGIQLGDSLTPIIQKISEVVQVLAEKLNSLTPA